MFDIFARGQRFGEGNVSSALGTHIILLVLGFVPVRIGFVYIIHRRIYYFEIVLFYSVPRYGPRDILTAVWFNS